MLYYNKVTGEFNKDDNLVQINEEEYNELNKLYEKEIQNGEKAIIYDTKLSMIDLQCGIRLNPDGSFRFTTKEDGDEVITVAEKNTVLKEEAEGYVHWYEDNTIKRALINEDEDFDWNEKKIVKKYNKEIRGLRDFLISLDVETIINNLGIRITLPEIGDVYLPVKADTKATVSLLSSMPSKYRVLVTYRLGENALLKESPVVLKEAELTDEVIVKISQKLLSFDADSDYAASEFIKKISNETNVDNLKFYKSNYARLLLELEEGRK